MYVPTRLSAARDLILSSGKFYDIMHSMKRSILFWISFVVAIILAVYFSTRIIMTCMGHGTAAIIRNISISADENDKDLSAIAAAAAVPPGTTATAVNLDAMAARICATPGVKTCAVRRMPNGNLRIKAHMHHAVALWTDGETYFPVSADGTIVKRPIDARDPAAVVFRGDLPNDITDITAAVRNIATETKYLEWIEDRRWNLITNGDITVMLPEKDPIAAVGSLVILNNNHRILNRDIRVIDMRDTARILVK